MSSVQLAARLSRFLERLNGVKVTQPPRRVSESRATLEIRDGHGRRYSLEIRHHG